MQDTKKKEVNWKDNPIIPFLVLIAIIVIAAFLIIININRNEAPPQQKNEQPDDQQAVEIAAKQAELLKCEIANSDDDCLAFATKNLSACDLMDNQNEITQCKDDFYLILAIKTKSQKLCENVVDDSIREGCSLFIKNDANSCEEFGTEDITLYCKALILDDLSACEKISDLVTKEDCKTDAIFYNAIKKGKIDGCNALEDIYEKTSCRAAIAEDKYICLEAGKSKCS